MHEHIRVDLIPRMVPVDDTTHAQREQVVQRLADLGHIDPATGTIPDQVQDGWLARVGGVEFPVVTYGVEPAEEGGRALVSLLIPADALSIGDPAVEEVRPTAEPVKPAPSSWGAPGPDPRVGIPGWEPAPPTKSLLDQIAARNTGGVTLCNVDNAGVNA